MPPPVTPPLLHTGVPNLDLILGGGIPREDVVLVIGLAGTGKTTLGLQRGTNLDGGWTSPARHWR